LFVRFRRKRDDLADKVRFRQAGGLAQKDDRIQNANRLISYFYSKYFFLLISI
jgi:hypothetical protein